MFNWKTFGEGNFRRYDESVEENEDRILQHIDRSKFSNYPWNYFHRGSGNGYYCDFTKRDIRIRSFSSMTQMIFLLTSREDYD